MRLLGIKQSLALIEKGTVCDSMHEILHCWASTGFEYRTLSTSVSWTPNLSVANTFVAIVTNRLQCNHLGKLVVMRYATSIKSMISHAQAIGKQLLIRSEAEHPHEIFVWRSSP